MRAVLSQTEIDDLLSAIESGSVDEEALRKDRVKAKKYDFRRPNRFSKHNIGALSVLHDSYARQMSNFLSGYLRTVVQVKVASVEQLAYEELVLSWPANTLVSVLDLEGYGYAMMQMSNEVMLPIVGLICGGVGEAFTKPRPVTDIEMSIYRRLTNHLLSRYEIAWRDQAEVKCTLDTVETNPRLVQCILPSEIVAVITLTMTVNDVQGLMSMCLPYTTVNSLLNKPSEVVLQEDDEVTVREKWEQKQRLLASAPLSLQVLLGEREITVRDFLSLQAGDVLAMDSRPGDLLELQIEGKSAFLGQPGLSRNQLAVQIVAPLTERD